MKKAIIILLVMVFIWSSVAEVCATFTSSFETNADIVYVVSAGDDETVIYDKNSEKKVPPAALVKIVTGILVIENCPDLSESVTASYDAIKRVEALKITTAGMLSGERMTVEQLLYCLLVYNANDAAVVLAEHVAGSERKFVEMMNDFSARLGLSNTLFADPGGYKADEQYSTARDLAVIFKYCMLNSIFEQISSTFLYEMPATNKYDETRYLKNTNQLINKAIPDYYFKYVKGGKSGYNDAGNCNVVSLASKDGYSYICVVLDAEEKNCDGDDVKENAAFYSSRELYEWVFENIKLRVVADTSTYVCEVKVRLSKDYDYVSLMPAENVSALVPAGVGGKSVLIEPISELTLTSVDAPVKKGDILGRATINYAGKEIAEVDLAAAFDVPVSAFAYVGDKILKFLKSGVFRIILLIALFIALPLFIIYLRNIWMRSKKKHASLDRKRQ